MNWWLVKQEPESYSFSQFQKEKITAWTGVRNFQARNNLKAMKKGDSVFYYHSGEEKQIVGTAVVAKAFYPDPTATEGDWVCVDLKAEKDFSTPVTLQKIKSEKALKEIPLLRQSRLSVMPIGTKEAKIILALSGKL